ncbi:hypothetical protein H2200_008508 [Cladophialophora chaetospira]|uniref:Reticulocyte-binding protein 2 like protein a n=1 Tax=Cladophialophora chaetospira TaxID=386627 RepID=A0AA39CGJ2_9EURO|nr:hypothetical protein H2200_008508 [Cladophialophora chaetospira]
MEAPPPPPPHGANAPGGGRSGGLPDGKYDIFVIPPHSSGSGFVYLPSLQTQRNSFLAGVFCTASAFFLYHVAVPVVKEWLFSTVNSGGTGVFTLVCGVAVVAWAFGKTQSEWQQPDASGRPGTGPGAGGQGAGYGSNGSYPHSHTQPPPHGANAPPNQGSPPQSSWQKAGPQANTKANTDGKTSWEKAREETRKREEERKRAEELKKRREELEKERQRQKDELEKDRLKAREKELRERLEREVKEKRDREEKEAAIKAAAEKIATEKVAAERERIRLEKEKQQGSPKRPPMPTATTEREDDAYSFRPYDRPKRTHKANSAASMYSESSYAPSVSTAKTSPPPSMRGPYSTKDPDKIVIKGVFSFNNAFMRTPISQLRSGQGNVTDGLILRITTEGLFIDDDVRGVPQREWDVKAWTMKLAEVWCPNVSSPGHDVNASPPKRKISLGLNADLRRETLSPSQNETSAFVVKLLKACGENCKGSSRTQARSFSSSGSSHSSFDATESTYSSTTSDTDSTVTQSCELAGLHVLRASIRDQEGKKYVFVLSQSEGWKVAVGLQKLRRGSQVRALGVAGMPMNEAKALLENLGYS